MGEFSLDESSSLGSIYDSRYSSPYTKRHHPNNLSRRKKTNDPPVEINDSSLSYIDLPPFYWSGYETQANNLSLKNTGKTR